MAHLIFFKPASKTLAARWLILANVKHPSTTSRAAQVALWDQNNLIQVFPSMLHMLHPLHPAMELLSHSNSNKKKIIKHVTQSFRKIQYSLRYSCTLCSAFLIHHYTNKTSYSLSFSEQSDAPKWHVCGKLPANLTYVYSIFGKRKKLKKFHMKDNKNKYEVASRELTYPPPKKGHFWVDDFPKFPNSSLDPLLIQWTRSSWHPLWNDMIHGGYHGISVQGDQWYIYICIYIYIIWVFSLSGGTPKTPQNDNF